MVIHDVICCFIFWRTSFFFTLYPMTSRGSTRQTHSFFQPRHFNLVAFFLWPPWFSGARTKCGTRMQEASCLTLPYSLEGPGSRQEGVTLCTFALSRWSSRLVLMAGWLSVEGGTSYRALCPFPCAPPDSAHHHRICCMSAAVRRRGHEKTEG